MFEYWFKYDIEKFPNIESDEVSAEKSEGNKTKKESDQINQLSEYKEFTQSNATKERKI